jgi:hypothetical protein
MGTSYSWSEVEGAVGGDEAGALPGIESGERQWGGGDAGDVAEEGCGGCRRLWRATIVQGLDSR